MRTPVPLEDSSVVAPQTSLPFSQRTLPPQSAPTGRPTELTTDRARKILVAIAAGMYQREAALLAGVNPTMLSKWLGRDGEPFTTFQNWVSEAEAHFEATMITKIAKHDDPKHAEWMLERKFPERWGKTVVVPAMNVNLNLTAMLTNVEQRARALQDPRGALPGAPTIIDAMRGDDPPPQLAAPVDADAEDSDDA